MARLLIVDDEQGFLAVAEKLLTNRGYEVVCNTSGEDVIEVIAKQAIATVICDIQMGSINGLDLLDQIRKQCPHVPVVMITAFGSVETALDSLRRGAFDYVNKPFRIDEFLTVIERAVAWFQEAGSESSNTIEVSYGLGQIVAHSEGARDICTMLQRLAPADTTILFRGERGVGKKLAARTVHELSRRREKVFVTVDCTKKDALRLESELFGHIEGAFEGAETDNDGAMLTAAGGTVWLDEIGMLPLPLQEKVLKVMKEKTIVPLGSDQELKVDVRLLAGTNLALEKLAAKGELIKDLQTRLSLISIHLKPLRERREDILPLARHFLSKLGPKDDEASQLEADARGALLHYDWPGNIRELELAIQHALENRSGPTIRGSDLPESVLHGISGDIGGHAVPGNASPRGQAARAYLDTKKADLSGQLLKRSTSNKTPGNGGSDS